MPAARGECIMKRYTFGSYPHDGERKNITWLILEQNGNEAKLISEYVLDACYQPPHSAFSEKKTFLIASVPLANHSHIRYTEAVRWQHPGNAYQRAYTPRIMQIVQIAGNIFSEQICLESANLQRVGIIQNNPEPQYFQGVPGFSVLV